MGSFLSEPITEKVSSDESNDRLKCGTSSMQGWRHSQEDAHNIILDYDTNTSYFAVYDGHGGHEVAVYTSQELPEFIKQTEAYKEGNYERALIDAFLEFDATITTPKVVKKLLQIAREKDDDEGDDDVEEENVSNLYEEASMPIEQVIEKYAGNLLNPKEKQSKDSESGPSSPLKAKKDTSASSSASCSSVSDLPGSSNACDENTVSSSNNSSEASSTVCNKPDSPNAVTSVSTTSNEVNHTTVKTDENPELPDSSNGNSEIPSKPDQSECSSVKKDVEKEASKSESKEVTNSAESIPTQNGEISPAKDKGSEEQSQKISSSTPQENGDVSRKGKGKSIIKSKGPQVYAVQTRHKRNASQLYNKFLVESDSESEDEEDKTFEGPIEDSSDDDDDEIFNSTIEPETSDSSIGEDDEGEEDMEDDDDKDEDGDDDDDDDDDDDLGDDDMKDIDLETMREKPGFDSGCTAVVALLKESTLYVANAGDSRCVLCRNGKAVEMSFDHKPEDETEYKRITKANGRVDSDGRVNGGLNLSRAIGDHSYKQNNDLSDREQMITALPDIRTININPVEDEFMVLACDGIWNSMSSQEVVDYVKTRISDGVTNLSTICEEMFDNCLAPDTFGDGTGCDNMTAIIIQFKQNIDKRPAPENDDEPSAKRAKTESQPECTPSV